MSVVRVGEYEVQLPDFWVSGAVREKPNFAAYNGIATAGVSFDFLVVPGRASDPSERANIVEAAIESWVPARHTTSAVAFKGHPLEVHRLEGCAALGPDAVYEMVFCDADDDLLHYGFSFTPPLATEESLRLLFMTMVNGAIVRAGQQRQGSGPPPAARRVGLRGVWDKLRGKR